MIMETQTHLENFLKDSLTPERSEFFRPDPLLVFEARQKVLSRKKSIRNSLNFFDSVFAFFKLELRFYHVGLSLLIISGGMFYLNEPNYRGSDATGLIPYSEALSINNTTVSVKSSTMLTSIPTLIIRN